MAVMQRWGLQLLLSRITEEEEEKEGGESCPSNCIALYVLSLPHNGAFPVHECEEGAFLQRCSRGPPRLFSHVCSGSFPGQKLSVSQLRGRTRLSRRSFPSARVRSFPAPEQSQEWGFFIFFGGGCLQHKSLRRVGARVIWSIGWFSCSFRLVRVFSGHKARSAWRGLTCARSIILEGFWGLLRSGFCGTRHSGKFAAHFLLPVCGAAPV